MWKRITKKSVYDRQHQARHLNTRSCSTCLEKQKTENASQLIFLFIDIIVHGHGAIANHASFLSRIAAVCTKTGCTAVQAWLSTTTALSGTPSSALAGDKVQHLFRGSRLRHPFRNKYRNCCWVSGMVWCKNVPPMAIWTRKRIDREGPPP